MTHPATTTVGELFACLARRDRDAAGVLWGDGAVYHVTGSHADAGDYPVADYLDFLDAWFERYPDYQVDDFQLTAWGDDVAVAHLVTRGGAAQGAASGLMVFRVEDGRITEGWGIPTFAGGRFPF